MSTITRAQLAAAIEAGIAASPGLLNSERRALRTVADTVTRVGTNYEHGCVAVLAGIAPPNEDQAVSEAYHATRAFVSGYDAHLGPLVPEGLWRVNHIEVVA
jgi:hypothetical protein